MTFGLNGTVPDPGPVAAKVVQKRGRIIAFNRDRKVIASGQVGPIENPIVLNAAINYVAGKWVGSGHGGGGSVVVSEDEYELASLVRLQPGVSVLSAGQAVFNRDGVPQGSTTTAHPFYGTTFTPTANLGSLDIRGDGTTVTKTPVFLLGTVMQASTTANGAGTSSTSLTLASAAGFPDIVPFTITIAGVSGAVTVNSRSGTSCTLSAAKTWADGAAVNVDDQSHTNPHGVTVRGINIDCRAKPTAQGLLIVDTQFVHVERVNIADAYSSGGRAIEVYSTIAPDDGAHGTRIDGSNIANCYDGIVGSGSGSTDSLITNCRITQYSNDGISLTHGGWQISGNHITSGSGSRYSINCGAPTTIINNYLDTTGDYHVYMDAICTVQGNIIKAGTSTRKALLLMTSNGYKSSVIGNVVQLAASQTALVKTSNSTAVLTATGPATTTSTSWRPVVALNEIGDGGVATVAGAVIDSNDLAIAESTAAMVTDTAPTTGGPNPYIAGNRVVASGW